MMIVTEAIVHKVTNGISANYHRSIYETQRPGYNADR